MAFIHNANPNFLREKGVGPNFTDWLAPDEHTDKTLLATAYWALIANMMSEMAHAVGNEDAAKRYRQAVGIYRATGRSKVTLITFLLGLAGVLIRIPLYPFWHIYLYLAEHVPYLLIPFVTKRALKAGALPRYDRFD